MIGGIASGKSLALNFFAEFGAKVIDADQIARALVEPGSVILDQIVTHFGESILTAEHSLNRAELRRRIFTDAGERRWLEQIMHPIIREKINMALHTSQKLYNVVAIPLLKQRSHYPDLKQIILIETSPALQLKRLLERDQIPLQLAESMISNQPSREDYHRLADHVIVNEDDMQALYAAIQKIDLEIRQNCI